MKKIMIILFIVLLYLPILLGGISETTSITTDVSLGGYYDSVAKPDLTFSSFLDGSFQNQFTNWFDKTFNPRGVIIKTYNTIQYLLFKEGNNIIGDNGTFYENYYVSTELCLENQYNFSLPEQQAEINTFVKTLAQVEQKLAEQDKALLVYITPSKAHHCFEEIPYKYRIQAPENRIRGVDFFVPLLEENRITYVYSDEYSSKLDTPAFYPTGIHWSRPFEQICDNELISKAAEVTKKNYRTIALTDMKTSNQPFFRDTDLEVLANLWKNRDDITFYEYTQSPVMVDQFDSFDILMQGGSFAKGLVRDVAEVYPDSNLMYINYNEYFSYNYGVETPFGGDWNQVPLGKMLDQTDCVIIEINEAVLTQYTRGFVQYLNSYLDSYVPQAVEAITAEQISYNEGFVIPEGAISGVWEDGWCSRYAVANIQNQNIAEKGLNIDFVVISELIKKNKNATVSIYINGKKVYNNIFNKEFDDSIYFSPEQLPKNQNGIPDMYNVIIITDASFIPAEMGTSSDLRELSVLIRYIGEGK